MTDTLEAIEAPDMLAQYKMPDGSTVGKGRVMKDALLRFSMDTGKGTATWNECLEPQDRAAYVGEVLSYYTERALKKIKIGSAGL